MMIYFTIQPPNYLIIIIDSNGVSMGNTHGRDTGLVSGSIIQVCRSVMCGLRTTTLKPLPRCELTWNSLDV